METLASLILYAVSGTCFFLLIARLGSKDRSGNHLHKPKANTPGNALAKAQSKDKPKAPVMDPNFASVIVPIAAMAMVSSNSHSETQGAVAECDDNTASDASEHTYSDSDDYSYDDGSNDFGGDIEL